MTEAEMKQLVEDAAKQHDLDTTVLEKLGSHLLWRIGRITDDGPVIVRIGMAGSAALFAELPRLRNISDAEVAQALQTRELRVEWVDHKIH